jgi:outer membrane protein TolC
MKARIMISTALLLSLLPVMGQKYTLEQCKQQALKQNKTYAAQKMNVAMAEQQKAEAFTHYFPTLEGTGTLFQANKDIMQMDIAIPVPNMGVLSHSMGYMKDGRMAMLTASQPIFAGGRIINHNKLAKIGKEAAVLKLKLSEEEVVRTTEELFWQIVQLKEKMQTINTLQKQVDRIYQDVKLAVKQGVKTRNDQLRVALRRQELASARLRLENGLNTLQLAICQYIGASPNEFSITYHSIQHPVSPAELYVEPKLAVQLRTESKLLAKNVRAKELEKSLELGKRLPTLGISTSLVNNNLLGKNENFIVGMVSLRIPISDWWGGSHAIKRKKIAFQQAQLERLNSEEKMEVQVSQVWGELQEAYKQILLAQTSIRSAKENLRLNTNCYKVGTIPLSELLDAQSLYQQSQEQYADAYTHYQLKKTIYKQLTGK